MRVNVASLLLGLRLLDRAHGAASDGAVYSANDTVHIVFSNHLVRGCRDAAGRVLHDV